MQSIIIFIGMAIFFHQMAVIETYHADIVQTAINNGNFKTLVAALGAADLVTTLKRHGPFTVFAPTDAAFNKLPPGTVDSLLRPENKAQLARILKYHVIAGQRLTCGQIKALPLPARVNMLDGGAITVSRNGHSLRVNYAKVVATNIMATNGIIHVIDSVLMPMARG